MAWIDLIFRSAASYLIGAIPFSWLFVRLIKGVDLRTVGSGNLGSTNAMRVLGTPLGLVIQALDILKGWLAVFLLTPCARESAIGAESGGQTLVPLFDATSCHAALVIGLAAVVGHVFPVYLKFRGGKGVNTSLGVFLALAPKAILLALAAGLAILALTRYVSLCSMTGAVVFPFAVGFFYPHQTALIIVAAVIGLLIVVLHRSNIRRLLNGTEARLGKKFHLEGSRETRPDRE
jgi:glycerol-3-phosphate acyltransferase PlsY